MAHVLLLGAIAEFFKEELTLLSKGENSVKSNRIKRYQFNAELLCINGEVFASMRKRFYTVNIQLDASRHIESATCTCPRGLYLCHHMAALCVFARDNISVTDVACKWNVMKQKEEVHAVDFYYPVREHQTTNRKPTAEETSNFRSQLEQYGGAVGFSWLLKPEPPSEQSFLLDIESIVFSEHYLNALDKTNFLLSQLLLDDTSIETIVRATTGQSTNASWLTARKNRLTASNFGAILKAYARGSRGGKFPISLFRRLTESYNLEGVKSIQWGKNHETIAIKEFCEAYDRKVTPTGLWVHSCGFLGASPDGLVDDDAIVEVKCPYKFRDKDLLEELKKDKKYIIYLTDNHDILVNVDHDYYAQIQGTLALTKRNLCYLVIWTPKQLIIKEIHKEESWEENFETLKDFYLQHYVLYLIENSKF
ncbi:uncharacterized protein LOC116179686 [Photinus pyralis]|uniref:uncharacterized protein LOC116179686 n=1 Tax=Photinus pyralis TaxID=7054 RepID=UPI00126710CE|nr:uncharacterized protein LOC116179686 [Photinus pyralis]XP_031355361.1 uncharacterized protein LOC116179686 [Photinus pyralis]